MPTLKNPRHERFAQEAASGKTLEESSRLAGFSGDRGSANRVRHRPDVKARISEILAEREKIHTQATARAIDKAGLSKEWVISGLRENFERAMQAIPVLDRKGNPTGEYVYEGAVANRALELLGKELGMFIERKELTGANGGPIEIRASKEQRDAAVRAALAATKS